MENDLIQRIREELNSRVDEPRRVNLVIQISDRTAQSMINFLDRALKSGLLDSKAVMIDAYGTDVRGVDKGNTEWYNEGEETEQWNKRLKPLD